MLHKRGALEMEKVMAEFEEINVENRKSKYEIARLKDELNRLKKQLQDSKLQTTEKEKEIWHLMQENDNNSNAIDKLLKKNDTLYLDLQKNLYQSELSKERPEKIEKSERLDRIDKLERQEKLAKYERIDRSERREKTYLKEIKATKNDVSSNDLMSSFSLKKLGSLPVNQKRGSNLSVEKIMDINEVNLNFKNGNSNIKNLSAVKSQKKEAKEQRVKSEKKGEKETQKKPVISINKETINLGTGNLLDANLKYSINVVETPSKQAISENVSYYEDDKSEREEVEDMNDKKVVRSVLTVSNKKKSKKAISYHEPRLGVRPKKEEVKELDIYPKGIKNNIKLQRGLIFLFMKFFN